MKSNDTTPTNLGVAMLDQSFKVMQQMQDQGEKFARLILDQGRQNREDGTKAAQGWVDFAQKWAELTRENQEQLQQMVHNTVRLSMDGYRTAQEQAIQQLTKQVDQLTKQVETLMPKAAK